MKPSRRPPKHTLIDDRSSVAQFEQIPNVGPATAGDFRVLGIATPQELIGRDPYTMYEELCTRTRQRHDPCVIDVFIAAVRFMEGAPATPWFTYTAERKAYLASRATSATQR